MKKRGFTLIELLVVISIIALLVSILMPALSKAREQAKAAVCLTQVKQWTQIFMMYTQENEDRFWLEKGNVAETLWMGVLVDYYDDVDELRVCPSATKGTNDSVNNPRYYGNTKECWGSSDETVNTNGYFPPGVYGSYGINHWINDLNESIFSGWKGPDNQWRKMPAKNADMVPMVGDCAWYGSNPDIDAVPGGTISGITDITETWNKDNPPEGTGLGSWAYDMTRFTMNRHSGGINMGFADGSTRKVEVPELWTLKWHKASKAYYDADIDLTW